MEREKERMGSRREWGKKKREDKIEIKREKEERKG